MSRIKKLFAEKQKNILSIYCTAGYPRLQDTLPVIQALEHAGVDMMELGIPYSDPLADGPVIQGSNGVALANGMSLPLLFSELKNFRDDVEMPVLLMGYLNPVLQYGFENFCREAVACGVDGLIIPDLPVYEFEKTYQAIVDKYELDFVFLVTPETSTERIRKLDSLSSGFLYAVTASSTTGSATSRELSNAFLKKLSEMGLKNPVMAGFGISSKEGLDEVCKYVSGGIVGSAFIKALALSEDVCLGVGDFIRELKR